MHQDSARREDWGLMATIICMSLAPAPTRWRRLHRRARNRCLAGGLPNDLYGLAVDKLGTVYVAVLNPSDGSQSQILKIASDGSTSKFADAPFAGGLVLDGQGGLYVTKATTGSVSLDYASIYHFDSLGTPTNVASSLVADPIGLALAPDGDLFAAEFAAPNSIVRVEANGTVHDFATNVGTPYGLAFGDDGLLYAAEFLGRRHQSPRCQRHANRIRQWAGLAEIPRQRPGYYASA